MSKSTVFTLTLASVTTVCFLSNVTKSVAQTDTKPKDHFIAPLDENTAKGIIGGADDGWCWPIDTCDGEDLTTGSKCSNVIFPGPGVPNPLQVCSRKVIGEDAEQCNLSIGNNYCTQSSEYNVHCGTQYRCAWREIEDSGQYACTWVVTSQDLCELIEMDLYGGCNYVDCDI